jgi:hypothetical protein
MKQEAGETQRPVAGALNKRREQRKLKGDLYGTWPFLTN